MLRLEVMGATARMLVNGQELAKRQHEGLDKRPGNIRLTARMGRPPEDGDVEVRFTDFKWYTLER